jgi:type IV secretory pathway VirB9-like protein
MKPATALTAIALVLSAITLPLHADNSARTIAYHSQDIVNIRAKVRYTTLIQLPTTEKIIEAATGDKEFWIIDVVSNFCFVHPAKTGIRSNLNLITDKGNIYSFTLEDVSNQSGDPDLKVIVQPADHSAIVASTGPAQYVPAAEIAAAQAQVQALQAHVNQAVDQYKDSYQAQLKFDYRYKANEAPFNIASIYHDDRFTYIKSDAQEKFTLYEVRDGAPNLINYNLRDGTYVVPKILDKGYVEIGKKRMEFDRKQGQ